MVIKCINFTVAQVTRRVADSERVQCARVRTLGLACAGLSTLSPSCIPSQKSVFVKSQVEFGPKIIPLSFKKIFLPLNTAFISDFILFVIQCLIWSFYCCDKTL